MTRFRFLLVPTLLIPVIPVAACGESTTAIPTAPADAGVDAAMALVGVGPASPGVALLPEGGAPPAVASSTPAAPAVPAVPPCSFDTHGIFPFQGRTVESITTKGRLFNFEADGSPWPTNGMDLGQVSYFAAGPCAGKGAGGCTFDTRTFAVFPGSHLVEFVTAYGRSFAWENGNPTDPGTDLASSTRYRDVCALGRAGPCVFDTRTFVNVNGQLTEVITAYGRYFAFDQQGNRSPDSGTDLTGVPRYAAGPCQGRAPGQCRLDTQVYGLSGERTVEIVTAVGRVWRWLADDPGFPEVEPSGVPLQSIPTWVVACP